MANWQVIVATGRLTGPTFFADRFIEYVKSQGIAYYIFDANDESTYNCAAFDIFASQPNTVLFTYNNIGVHLKDADGKSFWKKIYLFLILLLIIQGYLMIHWKIRKLIFIC